MNSGNFKKQDRGESNSLLNNVVVIITTRNRVKALLITIKKCLDIGLQQGQIYITDDASTDETPGIVRRNFPDVIVHVNGFQCGYINNRNHMMKTTSAKFILSLDDDSNLIGKNDLVEALELLDSKEEYGVFGFVPVEQPELPPSKENYKNEVFIARWYIGCGHIIKRSTVEKVGLYREEYIFYGEETDYSIRCFKSGLFVVSKRNLIVHHRVNYKDRDASIKADKNKGEYGILWRSEFAMANRLTHILINYPSSVIPYYFTKSISIFFINYVIKKRWFGCYKNALKLVVKRGKYIKKERNSLTLKQFREYMSLED